MVQAYFKIRPRHKKAPTGADYAQFVDDLEHFPGAVRKVIPRG